MLVSQVCFQHDALRRRQLSVEAGSASCAGNACVNPSHNTRPHLHARPLLSGCVLLHTSPLIFASSLTPLSPLLSLSLTLFLLPKNNKNNTGAAVSAKAQEVGAKVADAASEVAKKAQHDAAELASVVKEGVSTTTSSSGGAAAQ